MTSKGSMQKNLFCRDTYWKLVEDFNEKKVFVSVPGAKLRNCTYGDKCRGAHCEEEIKLLPHIKDFNNLDKSKIELVPIYNNIIQVMEISRSSIKNENFLNKLENLYDFNFIELMNLWFDITCYHRKLKKEMKSDPSIKSEFSNYNKIPEFKLENEDLVWSLERITKICSINSELNKKICQNVKCNIWEMCLASINCKLGCHNESHLLCADDFLIGKCNCQSKSDFEKTRQDLIEQINELNISIKEGKENNYSNKKILSLRKKVNSLYSQLNSTLRKVHYTEQGMVNFEKQLEDFNVLEGEKVRAEKQNVVMREEQMKSLVKKKLIKPKF